VRELVLSAKFKKDLSRVKKRGKNIKKLETVLAKLQSGEGLEPRYKDHALSGDMEGYRDLHIEPDWLLIYQVNESDLYLVRTGSHSDLFK